MLENNLKHKSLHNHQNKYQHIHIHKFLNMLLYNHRYIQTSMFQYMMCMH